MKTGNDEGDVGPTAAQVREELARVVDSGAFVAAPRLQQFLSYVVEKTLAGNGGEIIGKCIAIDVYGRDSSDVDAGQNLVRVEARRLRRRLRTYYSGSGKKNPCRIHIDLGGYKPRFEVVSEAEPAVGLLKPASPQSSRTKIILGTGVTVVLLAALAFGLKSNPGNPATEIPTDNVERAAYRERSVPSLQAVNLAEQTRGMFFPLFDLKRQQLSLESYRHVISLDPGLPHGYAGAAQILATLVMIAPDGADTTDWREEAMRMGEKALDLGPSDAWALAANSWVLTINGDLEKALSQAGLAAELAPRDGHVLDLAGLVAMTANAPRLAAAVTDPSRPRHGSGRFGAPNIWGVSQYVLGNYEGAIEAFTNAPGSGSPVSAPSLIFIAVAYDNLGEVDLAQRNVVELTATWPDFPTQEILGRFFANSPEVERDVLERLAKYTDKLQIPDSRQP